MLALVGSVFARLRLDWLSCVDSNLVKDIDLCISFGREVTGSMKIGSLESSEIQLLARTYTQKNICCKEGLLTQLLADEEGYVPAVK